MVVQYKLLNDPIVCNNTIGFTSFRISAALHVYMQMFTQGYSEIEFTEPYS